MPPFQGAHSWQSFGGRSASCGFAPLALKFPPILQFSPKLPGAKSSMGRSSSQRRDRRSCAAWKLRMPCLPCRVRSCAQRARRQHRLPIQMEPHPAKGWNPAQCHQRMHRSHSCSSAPEYRNNVARQRSARMESDPASPIFSCKLPSYLCDAVVRHAKPDDIRVDAHGSDRRGRRSTTPGQPLPRST